jgi:hypothetical protein
MLLAWPNVAAQWGHAWSLRFSCTARTCLVRPLAVPNAAAQWGHAWSLRFSCTARTCWSRLLGLTKVLSHCGQVCARLLCFASFTMVNSLIDAAQAVSD